VIRRQIDLSETQNLVLNLLGKIVKNIMDWSVNAKCIMDLMDIDVMIKTVSQAG